MYKNGKKFLGNNSKTTGPFSILIDSLRFKGVL